MSWIKKKTEVKLELGDCFLREIGFSYRRMSSIFKKYKEYNNCFMIIFCLKLKQSLLFILITHFEIVFDIIYNVL